MPDHDLAARLRASLARQEQRLRSSLILNPVENVPFGADLAVIAGPLHGLYNTDKVRTRSARLATPIQFADRQALERDTRAIYDAWAEALHAADVTLRLLSGLHAHIVLFMAAARPGDTVLMLPTEAGGHVSGKAIAERLGLNVLDMVVDYEAMCIDVDRTLALCACEQPDFIWVDRSEGLTFEDFSALGAVEGPLTMFDASQYLSNIICGDHPNPFSWGFDLMAATVHKNFPGPQKALLASRSVDERWTRILSGISIYVSNMHSASIYAAGLTLARRDWLAGYSRRMLELAVSLEAELLARGVPAVKRRDDWPPTHHVWIREDGRDRAFATYEALERCLILTNFRQLPYSLGYGIRLGVSAAANIGLLHEDVPELADLIADIRRRGPTPELQRRAKAFNEMIWARRE